MRSTCSGPQLQAAYRDHFRRKQIEAIVFPTTPLPAAPIGDDETVLLNGQRVPTFFTFIRNSSPGSVAGIPGISLPAALTDAGLPLGIELDAAEGADARLLAIALAVEGRAAEAARSQDLSRRYRMTQVPFVPAPSSHPFRRCRHRRARHRLGRARPSRRRRNSRSASSSP
jgi:hypothetical protein